MKRYIIDSFIRYDTDGTNAEAAMVEAEDGEWVRYDEAAAEIERLRSVLGRIDRLCHGAKSDKYGPAQIAMEYIAWITIDVLNPPTA
jgi:hypothetical protein